MPLRVLSERDVSRILHSLTKDDILDLHQALGDALHWYSTSNDATDVCSDYQPERTLLKRKDGSTTLFLPASGTIGQGVKVINITPADAAGLPSLSESSSMDSDHASVNSTESPSLSSARESLSSLNLTESSRSGSRTHSPVASSRTSVSQTSVSSAPGGSVPNIRGSLTLMDNAGNTVGLINAEEVTAFRTALASTILLKKRRDVREVTVFGAGKQAYWHIRLTMLLRPAEIRHLNIVTRNFESARNCIVRLYNPQPDDPDYDNPVGDNYNASTKKSILTPQHTEYARLLKEYVRASHVIYMTTPSSTPLFPAGFLINPAGRKQGRYISCVGSFKPHMIELHPDVLRYAVAPHHEHRHIHKRQKEGGAVIVDTVSGCLKQAGEVIQAKLLPDQVVELGELFMLKREAERKCAEKGEKVEGGCSFQEDSGMKEWLTRGNVIYKSVGLGLMDVVIGNELLRLAQLKGIGTVIEDF